MIINNTQPIYELVFIIVERLKLTNMKITVHGTANDGYVILGLPKFEDLIILLL